MPRKGEERATMAFAESYVSSACYVSLFQNSINDESIQSILFLTFFIHKTNDYDGLDTRFNYLISTESSADKKVVLASAGRDIPTIF